MFVKNRGIKVSAFGALVIAGLLVFQSAVSAHHPEIRATPVCLTETTARITVTTSAWTTPEPDHRINTNVVVTIANQTFNGAFNAANGYQFSVVIAVPADGATYVARATAVAPWGANGEFGSAGEFRETSVTAPNPCAASNSTTTTTTMTTTTTSSTTTTTPPTTIPPTTVPSSTITPTTVAQSTTAPPTTAAAITTGAPTTTIGVEVGGIVEQRVAVGALARTGPRPITLFLLIGLALVVAGVFIELRARTRSIA